MKTLLIAVNSKYIHSALAPWYLKACCGSGFGDILVKEFTINDSADSVLMRIYRERPDVAAFSCYIWNIDFIVKLAANLKKILPDVKIIFGGPEVSFDATAALETWNFVDYIISGEGEAVMPRVLSFIREHILSKPGEVEYPADLPGLSFRDEACRIHTYPQAAAVNLDELPSPFTEEMLGEIGSRIIYYESSRGCPFSCSYCLSSISKGVRFFAMDRVRQELRTIVKSGVRQIKFVDRTFNCNKARAAEIFRFIIKEFTDAYGNALLNFHFEAAADLFDEELLEILGKAPIGLIQLEIGVQTVNPSALEAINRKTDLDKLFYNFRKLREKNNIHLHLDLIAGLPFDDYNSFQKSFNRVYEARPHQLQLGFLKLLKGSELRAGQVEFGYVFRENTPYEVLSCNFMSYDELSELKGIEELLDRYYNSAKFVHSLPFLITNSSDSGFDFYRQLYSHYEERGLNQAPVAMKELYSILYDFAAKYLKDEKFSRFADLLRFDFLVSDSSGCLPAILRREAGQGFKERCFDFLKAEENLKKYLPNYSGMPAKQIIKQVHFETFSFNVMEMDSICGELTLLFDYSLKNAVTGLYRHVSINLK